MSRFIKIKKSEELDSLIELASPEFLASQFWIDQYDRCAMEHLDSLSADSSPDAISRVVNLCSRWAEASLDAAEARWGVRPK